MGGARETVVESSASKSDRPDIHAGDIRIHESQGKVHFHDDKAGLKVVVPVAEFDVAWNKYKSGFSDPPLLFIDQDQKTAAHVQVSLVPSSPDSQLSISIRLERIKIDESYAKFEKFAEGN